MNRDRHQKTPLFTALKNYSQSAIAPFDVPGHKMGNFHNELEEFVGSRLYQMDVNAPKGLDNLAHPTNVIEEAQELMADAFGAKRSFLLVNGTTVGILAMIMTACRAKEKIIMPRNVHKSAINALILSGAIPVYVEPTIDQRLGIANGTRYSQFAKAIKENPDAKAVFIINPTYFGVVSDLKKIIDLSHAHGMKALVDEAHGAHFAFSPQFPKSAMRLGADMSAASIHKTAGSLTQSSVLLINDETVSYARVRMTLNMLHSTSPNYLLLASLDVARKAMVLEGEEKLAEALQLARYARQKINQIPGLEAVDKTYFTKQGEFDFDETKLIIRINDLGLSGFEVYNLLRFNYQVQLELAETYVILAIISVGTTKTHIDQLIHGLEQLSNLHFKKKAPFQVAQFHYLFPPMMVRPREAYHAPKKIVPMLDTVGEISAETIMIYPPGIPILVAGEVITEDVIKMLQFYESQGSMILKEDDDETIRIIDKSKWIKWEGD